MKYSEATEGNDYLSLPQIDKGAVRLLGYSDFWDGPKSGLLMLANFFRDLAWPIEK
jgi:hypothetical protein